jgi:hypothetical protein
MLHSESRSTPLRRTDIFLDKAAWEGLKVRAKALDVSASEVVRRLIAAELKRPMKAAKRIVAPF